MDESVSKPVVYLFHGDDPVAIERHIADLLAHMGDPGMAELNTSRLDGRQASQEDLRTAALAMPFLAPRRLVILRNPLARAEGKSKAAQERLMALLDEIPPSTALVLVVEDYMDRGDWKLLPVNKPHWLREWLGKAGKRALLRECPLPPVGAMPGWISKQAEGMGGRFAPSAAHALASLVGNETQVALQEIRKLLEYANYQRAVEQEDVELLTAVTAQANIFEMVDALAEGNASKAQRLLQVLMEMDRESVFGMVVRQFRLLIQAREALDDGLSLDQVGKEMGQKAFVTRKMVGQAQRFTLPRLESLYHQLLEIDEAVKTSQMTLETALNLLVVDVGQ